MPKLTTTLKQRPEKPMQHYLVHWEIDIEAENPRAAALLVWTEIFGGSPEPGPDECCFFEVIDVEGETNPIDLSVAVEDLP